MTPRSRDERLTVCSGGELGFEVNIQTRRFISWCCLRCFAVLAFEAAMCLSVCSLILCMTDALLKKKDIEFCSS